MARRTPAEPGTSPGTWLIRLLLLGVVGAAGALVVKGPEWFAAFTTPRGELVTKALVDAELAPEIVRNASQCVAPLQLRLRRRVPCLSERKGRGVIHDPEAVVLQVPERVLWVHPPRRPSKLPQHLRQGGIDLSERKGR